MAVLDKEIQILMLKGEKGDLGGTTNYEDLNNKPKINGNELSGNKTAGDLGLALQSDLSSVISDIGTLSDLGTTAKNNLVAAVNEINGDTFGANIESGTWTMTLMNLYGTDPTYDVLYTKTAYYKIGKLVYVNGFMRVNITASTTGTCCIGGLPFVVSNVGDAQELAIVFTVTQQTSFFYGKFDNNTNYLRVLTASGAAIMDGWSVSNGVSARVNAVYLTN